jgi:serine/threonine protein kinase
MNDRTDRCDRRRIDAFLASDPDELRDAPLVAHLDVCSRCRNYMEQSAAAPQKWSEAATCLLASEFDLSSSIEYSAASLEIGKPDIPTSIQNVLDSLAPSDDPHRLGRLGGYEISGIIGVGGMGVVLKAVDTALDRVVAIKVMAPHLASHATARKRFAREAKAAAAVLHPNVIPIHSVSSDEATPYLVMGYVRGGSLQKRLDREGTLSTVEILRIGSQIAAGLSAAHEQGLVHRDIKPENILLEEGVERLTLTDFGLARAVDDASLTQHGAIAGTPQYMSPEQARGEAVDQASDLFSLGSVLYTLCTGRVPFRAESSHTVMRKIIDEAPKPIRELNPEIPEWLVGIIDQLLAKDKKNRFPSAEELHILLDACLSHVQQPTAVDLPESLRSAQRIKRRPLFLATLGSLLMTTIFTTLLWLTGALAFLVQESPRPQASNDPAVLQQEKGVEPIDKGNSNDLAFFNEGPVLIKGRIENARNKQVLLLNSELTGEVEHVLNLDKEGNFEFQFEVLSAHDIAIKTNGKTIDLFASPQDSIYLEVDISRFDESLTFKGSNAGTNKSLNVFRRKFREHLEEKQFFLKKRDLQPAAFKHFTDGFFYELEKEVISIAETHHPSRQGVEWMKTYIKYRHGEELLEYGSHHRDRLPDDYYDFESEFKTTNKYALECSQYYDDFALKYHIPHKLSSRPEFFGIIAAFQDQNFEGVKTTFEFLGCERGRQFGEDPCSHTNADPSHRIRLRHCASFAAGVHQYCARHQLSKFHKASHRIETSREGLGEQS